MRCSTLAAFLLVLSTATLASGCGSSSGDAEVAPPAAAPAPAPAPAPSPPAPADIHGTLHFFAQKNGRSSEVTTIVYSDRVVTRLEGLPPRTEVDLSMTVYTPQSPGRGYVSKATFIADDSGVVETDKATATRGTYTGVDPDGLFWSAMEGAVPEGLGPDRQAGYFEARVGNASVARGSLGRTFVSPGVTIESVTDDGLVAQYFLPPGGASDQVPIVAFGGSEGGISGGASFAAHAASEGHPALAIAYFGTKGVPADLTEVPLEYFAKAFAWLDRRPELRKGKVVVMGGSRGGELALQLGATFPAVVGVIAETPSSVRWASVAASDKAAWTFEGKDLAYVPSASAGFPPTVDGPGGAPAYVLRDGFETSLAKAKPEAIEAARIHVEDTRGPILMLAGSDDQMWPACGFVQRAMSELQKSGHAAQHQDEGVCFTGAGHSVGAAGLPAGGSMWAELGDGTLFSLGGTAKANAQAGRQSHEKIRAFLERVTK